MDSMCTEMDMTSLSKPVHSHVQDAKFPPIKGSLEARCKLAIKVIASVSMLGPSRTSPHVSVVYKFNLWDFGVYMYTLHQCFGMQIR